MTPLRRQTAMIAIGASSILVGAALILANLPAGKGLVVAGFVGLALTLGIRR